eukprot:1842779-Amphidinium_carterae.1
MSNPAKWKITSKSKVDSSSTSLERRHYLRSFGFSPSCGVVSRGGVFESSDLKYAALVRYMV